MVIYLLLLLFLGPLTFHIVTRYNRRGRILRKIPGPTPYPFVGNLLKFNVSCLRECNSFLLILSIKSNTYETQRNLFFLDEFWEVAREITNTYYPITRFWLCKTAVISVRHPDDIEVRRLIFLKLFL